MGREKLTAQQKQIIRRVFQEAQAAEEARHAAATEVLALKITMEEPAPDGTFEILFMTRAEADAFHQRRLLEGRWATSKDVIEEVSFAEGVRLARQPDCSGGQHILGVARRFVAINPVVAALDLEI